MTVRLFHVSDLHFGAEDQSALDWFAGIVRDEVPDAILMTGDLTQSARAHEFEAAAAWLESLDRPVTIEVGNHDLPVYNPVQRMLLPYRRYRALERMLEQPLDIAGVTIVPLRTTARLQLRLDWSKGFVSRRRLDKAVKLIEAASDDGLVFVTAHHPLIEAGTRTRASTRGGERALSALVKAGAHAVLTGHVHDPFDIDHRHEGREVRLIGAGTLSERVRETRPSFNEIRVEGRAFETIARVMDAPDERL
ncbi:metallophosphoesterase family protein [Sphingomonas qomolangmaensis]|uniref:Metallophosphoesterase n=1 Tax=Sphingomonas qomolangmaensis TaxID=2918765 RepID=A0ABY5LA45_9SPHN|nr:metallophosphoesterase [Sphingomonas qomolangmaensis]UUL82826.1 metallophosphoesterase [Sphingomonas qomolangmaensis]